MTAETLVPVFLVAGAESDPFSASSGADIVLLILQPTLLRGVLETVPPGNAQACPAETARKGVVNPPTDQEPVAAKAPAETRRLLRKRWHTKHAAAQSSLLGTEMRQWKFVKIQCADLTSLLLLSSTERSS